MIMSTELVLMGKLHRSQRTVSMGNPDALFKGIPKGSELITSISDRMKSVHVHVPAHLPLSALRFCMCQILLTVRLTAMSLLSPAT